MGMDESRKPILDIIIWGKAEPAGSKRAFVNPKTGRAIVVDDNAKSKPWKTHVAQIAAENLPVGEELYQGAVRVEFDFFLVRPQGHYGSGRNRGFVKDSAPAYPTVRPDVLKLARGIEDALTGVVWNDDAQITDETLRKFYGDRARVRVRVWPMEIQAASGLPLEDRIRGDLPAGSAGEQQSLAAVA